MRKDKKIFFVGLLLTAVVFANDPLPVDQTWISREIIEKAEQGNPSAQYQLGYYLTMVKDGKQKNPEDGIKWLLQAAEKGYEKAQFDLAQFYLGGLYVKKDELEAVKWYLKAAKQGNSKALEQLSNIFINGQGEEKFKNPIYQEASLLIANDPKQENAKKYFVESIKYFNGNGVEKNVEKGLELMQRSSDLGYLDASAILGQMLFNGENGAEKDRKKAVALFLKVAEARNDPINQSFLGDCYYNGNGVDLNYEEAFKWYKKAASGGLPSFELGECYFYGLGVLADKEKAIEIYKTAAKNQDLLALIALTDCYKKGDGVIKDEKEANIWLQTANDSAKKAMPHILKAAETEDLKSQYILGILYLNGYGVEKNEKEGKKWLGKASANGCKKASRLFSEAGQVAE